MKKSYVLSSRRTLSTIDSMKQTFLNTKEKNNFLERIKTRNLSNEGSITGNIAGKVVKDYIIPMFEYEYRSKSYSERRLKYGLNEKKYLLPVKNTVFEELKLSEALTNQLEDLQNKLNENERVTKTFIQEKHGLINELDQCKKFLFDMSSNLKILSLENWNLSKELLMYKNFQNFDENIVIKNEITKISIENTQLKQELQDSKAKNDKMKNKIIQINHSNDILKLEKEIMEDRIKGLYDSWVGLIGKYSVFAKLKEEYQKLSESLVVLANHESRVTKDYKNIIKQRNELIEDSIQLEKFKTEGITKRDKILKTFEKKFKKTEKDLIFVTEERDKLKSFVFDLENKLTSLSEELKTRKQLNFKSTDSEEKICGSCFSVFYENNNFNWSCRTHKSQLAGNRYWCCNMVGKDAPGCSLSKHYSKEDMMNIKNFEPFSKFCVECKETGHDISSCAKDPNVKNVRNVEDEINRLKSFEKRKKKNANLMCLQDKALELMKVKMCKSQFLKIVESDDEETDGVFFKEIMDIKEGLGLKMENVDKVEKEAVETDAKN